MHHVVSGNLPAIMVKVSALMFMYYLFFSSVLDFVIFVINVSAFRCCRLAYFREARPFRLFYLDGYVDLLPSTRVQWIQTEIEGGFNTR